MNDRQRRRVASGTAVRNADSMTRSENRKTSMADSDYLTNQFLVAMPSLTDSKFARTVTFIWQHNADEALGIIINRPLQMRLADVFEQMQMPMSAGVRGTQPVLQ